MHPCTALCAPRLALCLVLTVYLHHPGQVRGQLGADRYAVMMQTFNYFQDILQAGAARGAGAVAAGRAAHASRA